MVPLHPIGCHLGAMGCPLGVPMMSHGCYGVALGCPHVPWDVPWVSPCPPAAMGWLLWGGTWMSPCPLRWPLGAMGCPLGVPLSPSRYGVAPGCPHDVSWVLWDITWVSP